MRTMWGRVGAFPQTRDKVVGDSELQRTIAEKVGKGYREVELHVPIASTPANAPALHLMAPRCVTQGHATPRPYLRRGR